MRTWTDGQGGGGAGAKADSMKGNNPGEATRDMGASGNPKTMTNMPGHCYRVACSPRRSDSTHFAILLFLLAWRCNWPSHIHPTVWIFCLFLRRFENLEGTQ